MELYRGVAMDSIELWKIAAANDNGSTQKAPKIRAVRFVSNASGSQVIVHRGTDASNDQMASRNDEKPEVML